MQDKIYYRIGEVCKLTGLKPSVIRFWEKEFRQIHPVKIGSNQRYYTKEHIALLNRIKTLLYEEKLTIEGARKKLKDNPGITIEDVKKELLNLLEFLKNT